MIYSKNQLTSLAHDNPKELMRILTSPDVDVATLTYGVEIMGGEVSDDELTLPVFRKLLRHVHAVVREGAMMGVSAFFSNKTLPQDLLDRLKVMAHSDPSPSNKAYARDLLDDFQSK
jgi:hypothetical protein